MVNLLRLPASVHPALQANVSAFIQNQSWSIPAALSAKFPSLIREIEQVVIPLIQKEGQVIWKHTDNGEMCFKDAFNFLRSPGQIMP